MEPLFFQSGAEFRKWLERHHGNIPELLVGFYRRGAVKQGLGYAQAVDEALCFGWIDGVRKSRDAESYTIRFTPRKPGSVWSAVNLKRARELIESERMAPSGLAAFEGRDRKRAGLYAYENKTRELEGSYADRLRSNPKAREFFEAQPPWYRRVAAWWIVSAKKEATRQSRLEQLIEGCARGERLGRWSYEKRAK